MPLILKDDFVPATPSANNLNRTKLAKMVRTFASGNSIFWNIILTRKLDSPCRSLSLWRDEVDRAITKANSILLPSVELSMEEGAAVVREAGSALGVILARGEAGPGDLELELLDRESARLIEAIAKGCMTAIPIIPPEELYKITAEAANLLPGFTPELAISLWRSLNIDVSLTIPTLQTWACSLTRSSGREMARKSIMEYTFR